MTSVALALSAGVEECGCILKGCWLLSCSMFVPAGGKVSTNLNESINGLDCLVRIYSCRILLLGCALFWNEGEDWMP